MRLRRWKVEREIVLARNVVLPARPEFFFTRRGAEGYMSFADLLGGPIRATKLSRV